MQLFTISTILGNGLLLSTISTSLAFSSSGTRAKFRSPGPPRTGGTYDELQIEPNRTPSTRIHFQSDGDNDAHPPSSSTGNEKPFYAVNTPSPSSMATLFWRKPMASEDDEESRTTSHEVDLYLEFLDRRYNRLRENEQRGLVHRRKQFSVLNWLFHEEQPLRMPREHEPRRATLDKPSDEDDQGRCSNALYALGVAGLASERLLQKHGVQLKKCTIIPPPPSSDVVAREGSPALSDNKSLSPSNMSPRATLVAALIARCAYLVHRFNVKLVNLQDGVSQQALRVVKRAIASAPCALRTVWTVGGGQHTVRFATFTLCAVLLHVAQPLLKSSLSTGARSQVQI